MNDKVYPSAKPAAPDAGANPTFPPTKSQLYNSRRPVYRPQIPQNRGHRRGCCCRCCLWTTAVIFIIIVLAAIAGGVFYLIYRPYRPTFSINSIALSNFNVTDTSVISLFNISVIARNPNSRITIIYDQSTVQLISGDVDVGDGSFPGFTQDAKNTTNLRAVVTSSNNAIDSSDLSALQSSVRKKTLPLKIQLDTKIRAKIGKIRTLKLGIRVTCDGMTIAIPSGKTATSATSSNIKCKLVPRIKILRWTI